MMSQVRVPTEQRMDFAFENLPTCGLIKSNAFPLTPPGEIYEFDLKNWPEEKVWDYFDKCTEGREVVVIVQYMASYDIAYHDIYGILTPN